MARNKPAARKRRLARAAKTRKSVPTWAVAKTQGRFRSHPKKRNWREGKLKA